MIHRCLEKALDVVHWSVCALELVRSQDPQVFAFFRARQTGVATSDSPSHHDQHQHRRVTERRTHSQSRRNLICQATLDQVETDLGLRDATSTRIEVKLNKYRRSGCDYYRQVRAAPVAREKTGSSKLFSRLPLQPQARELRLIFSRGSSSSLIPPALPSH